MFTAITAPPARHTHVIFDLSNGAQLHFTDVRQFGQLWLVPCTSLDSLTGLKNLGVEPLEPQFTRDYLKRELRRRHARIKPLLLDQTIIAGLGNIYTDEALHRAKINPERLATTLTPREIASLYRAIKDVLQEGIDSRGTTVRNYVDGEGQSGSYQEQLRVYSREGEPCSHCGKTIVKEGGRTQLLLLPCLPESQVNPQAIDWQEPTLCCPHRLNKKQHLIHGRQRDLELLSYFLFALALNIDSFVAGLAYGARQIKVPLLSLLIISLISRSRHQHIHGGERCSWP